jgi:hypothetical protein
MHVAAELGGLAASLWAALHKCMLELAVWLPLCWIKCFTQYLEKILQFHTIERSAGWVLHPPAAPSSRMAQGTNPLNTRNLHLCILL